MMSVQLKKELLGHNTSILKQKIQAPLQDKHKKVVEYLIITCREKVDALLSEIKSVNEELNKEPEELKDFADYAILANK